MPERRSVCVLVHVPRPFRILLLRRPEARAAGWQPVTGRLELADAEGPPPRWLGPPPDCADADALGRAAIREIGEECALPAPQALLDLGIETSFLGYDGTTYRQRFLAAPYDAPHPPTCSPEHEEARWADADDALALLRWDDDKAALRRLLHHIDHPPPREDGAAY